MIVYQDEVHFQVTTSVTRTWVPKGTKPRISSSARRENASYSGFVRPDTGELVVTKPSWFNYESTIESLRTMLSELDVGKGKRIYLVLDNASWHKKAVRLIQKEALPEYADIREKMTFVFLPPYSPDLNPIEQVWRITRREVTHNTYFSNVEKLSSALDEYFANLRKPNAKLSSLCSFKHKS